jgi:hypothetical protein
MRESTHNEGRLAIRRKSAAVAAAALIGAMALAPSGQGRASAAPAVRVSGVPLRSIPFPAHSGGRLVPGQRLLPRSGTRPELGYSVAIDGDVAVAGAPFANNKAGEIIIYHFFGGRWHQERISSPRPADKAEFGFSVAVSGTTVLVGDFPGGKGDTKGIVRFYALKGGKWKLSEIFTDPDTSFGMGVGISGNTAVVGQPLAYKGKGISWVLVRNNGRWRVQGSLTDLKVRKNAQLGFYEAVDGSSVVVSGAYEGAVVFTRHGGKWFNQGSLGSVRTAPKWVSQVSLSGNTAVVGRWLWNQSRGAVYVYTHKGRRWVQTARLLAPHPEPKSYFGNGVALDGNRLVIGAPNKGARKCGTAFEYTKARGNWKLAAKIKNPDCTVNDWFGYPTALSGRTAIFGAIGKNHFAGNVYVQQVK